MIFLHMPRIILLHKTIRNQDFLHSILISLLRGLAALQVTAAHLRAQIYPGLKGLEDPTLWYQALAFFTGFAHQAVVIFFLLSGWLVGGSLLNRLHERDALAAYAIDRVTRLWIVLVPAFLLTLVIGAITHAVDPAVASFDHRNDYSLPAFIGNLFGLQDMAVPRFGGNFPLWSLANETWYYVLFPLLLFPFYGREVLGRWAAGATAIFIAYHLSGPIMLYLPVWMLGVVFSRIRIDAMAAQRGLLGAVFVAVSVYFRLTGSNDKLEAASFVQDALFSVLFLLLLSSLQFKADLSSRLVRLAAKVGAVLAAFSFTLYLVHVPILVLLRHFYVPLSDADLSPHDPEQLVVYGVMLLLMVSLAYLFHLPFEAQTQRVREWIKAAVLHPQRAGQGGRPLFVRPAERLHASQSDPGN